MQITRVALTNIKNYSEQSFKFGLGVIAICGPNGAGKTTILEAIAWSLFDHLAYTRENFIKKGEKKGSVRVAFISSEDGREYEVYRDTAGAYYVFDPQLKVKLVEQKSQVSKWLRQHLGVEPGTDLATLFRTTIGVPQGTFTVDFAESAARRKPTFDKILKVEEYQRSAELLRGVVRLIEQKLAQAREQIAGAEGELKRYDEVAREKEALAAQSALSQQRLAEANAEREETLRLLKELEDLKNQLDQATRESERLDFRLAQTEQQHAVARSEYERARIAATVVERTAAGYKSYVDASESLRRLEADRSTRDGLLKQLNQIETAKVRLQGVLEQIIAQLGDIAIAREQIGHLDQSIKLQEELESQRADLQRQAGQRQSLEESVRETESELESLRTRYTELSLQIEATERLKSSAERTARLESDRAEAERVLQQRELAFKTIQNKRDQFLQIKSAVQRTMEEVGSLESQLAIASEKATIGARLAELEAGFQQITDELARLNAEIKKDERMLREVKSGLCPLLSEPCRNMAPGQTLNQFFSLQLGDNQAKLTTLKQTREQMESELGLARQAATEAAAVGHLSVTLANRRADLKIQADQITELEADLAAAGDVSEDSLVAARAQLKGLDAELFVARAALVEYERLAPLRRQMEQIKEEGLRRRQQYDSQRDRLANLTASVSRLGELERQLAELQDPRGRQKMLIKLVEQEPAVLRQQAKEQQREQELSNQHAEFLVELEPFANLDQSWQAAIASQAANQRDYQDYLANANLASTVETRELELSRLADSVESLQVEAAQAKAAVTALTERYDQRQHITAREQLEATRTRIAQLEAEVTGLARQLDTVTRELDHLNEVKARVSVQIARRMRLEELSSLSEFMRDCFKQAGPHITEAYLYTISINANQLYREITGNAMVNLRWDKEYEIILEEGGRERPFANLSGGEQMAAALAVRLALLNELSDLRIAFFDEPTTNMDEERRRNLAQQIGRIKDFDQLFIISHDDSFEGYTDEVINLSKQQAASSLA